MSFKRRARRRFLANTSLEVSGGFVLGIAVEHQIPGELLLLHKRLNVYMLWIILG